MPFLYNAAHSKVRFIAPMAFDMSMGKGAFCLFLAPDMIRFPRWLRLSIFLLCIHNVLLVMMCMICANLCDISDGPILLVISVRHIGLYDEHSSLPPLFLYMCTIAPSAHFPGISCPCRILLVSMRVGRVSVARVAL